MNGKPNGADAAPVQPTPAQVGLAVLDASLRAEIAVLLSIAQAGDVMNLLIEHLSHILALVEPMQLRNDILGEIRRNLPGVVNRHYEARMTTAGGVRLPT
jgi:hypothetical protein